MKTTTIKINHPTANEVMKLEDLSEVCFRISEHITEYWENIERCMAYLSDDQRAVLARNCSNTIRYTNMAAWNINRLVKAFGDLPF